MKHFNFFLIVLAGFLLTFTPPRSLNAQNNTATEQFKGKTYVKHNGKWSLSIPEEKEINYVEATKIGVIYRDGITSADIKQIEDANNLIPRWHRYHLERSYNIIQTDSLFDISKRLLADNKVKDVIICLYGHFNAVPNDSAYTTQWYFNEAGSDPTIEMEGAWDITTGNPEVTIAVIDAGFDWTHEDIGLGTDGYENIYTNPDDSWTNPLDPYSGDGIDNDSNGYVDDFRGWDFYGDSINPDNNTNSYHSDDHGLNVASIIGAKTNNITGMAGIAGGWNGEGCKIIPCRIGDAGGQKDKISIFDLIEAIYYAIDNDVDIIQLSLSLNDYDNNGFIWTEQAINEAYYQGITIICSSGNNGWTDSISFPSSLPHVISVNGSTWQDEQYQDGNCGPGLDLAAPGDAVLVSKTTVDDGYYFVDGTSFAAPIVSGIAALMKSVNPCLGPPQIKDILISTADKITYSYCNGHSTEFGYGKVNARKAVQAAMDLMTDDIDLYIKARYDDLGLRDSAYSMAWPRDASPDIWVRNQQDSGFIHQNPNFSGDTAYVYARARNRSCGTSTTMKMSMYYKAASTNSGDFPVDWTLLGTEYIDLTGSSGNPVTEDILEFEWDLSPLSGDTGACLLAIIDDDAGEDPFPDYTGDINISPYFDSTNNMALKNVIVVHTSSYAAWNGMDVAPGGSFIIGENHYDYTREFDIIFGENADKNSALLDEAEINIYVTDEFWDIVENSPEVDFNGIRIIGENQLRITEADASVNRLRFGSGQSTQIYTGFNFYGEFAEDGDVYRCYSVKQFNSEEEKCMGNMHFQIIKEARERFEADGGGDSEIYSGTVAAFTGNQLSEPACYRWYNKKDSLLSSGKTFLAAPQASGKYIYEIVAEKDGFKAYDTVFVKINPYKIVSVAPNPATNMLTIDYIADKATTAQIMFQLTGDPKIQYSYTVDPNLTQMTINLSALPKGVYSVILVCDGKNADSKNVMIQ